MNNSQLRKLLVRAQGDLLAAWGRIERQSQIIRELLNNTRLVWLGFPKKAANDNSF